MQICNCNLNCSIKVQFRIIRHTTIFNNVTIRSKITRRTGIRKVIPATYRTNRWIIDHMKVIFPHVRITVSKKLIGFMVIPICIHIIYRETGNSWVTRIKSFPEVSSYFRTTYPFPVIMFFSITSTNPTYATQFGCNKKVFFRRCNGGKIALQTVITGRISICFRIRPGNSII